MKKLFILIMLSLLFCFSSCSVLPNNYEDFSFSLTWNVYGISSYDSKTGKLVKTTDATNPEEYITTYFLSEEELDSIYKMIKNLNVSTYPDDFDPKNGHSCPSMTLILTVNVDSYTKTISAKDIALSYESYSIKGKKYLNTCKYIKDLLMSTDEWKALPDYEFLYD